MQNLYINNQATDNNKYFETAENLLKYSDKKMNEIKAYKKRTGFLKNSNSLTLLYIKYIKTNMQAFFI